MKKEIGKKCAPKCEIIEDALDFQLAEHQNEETTHYELDEEDEMGYLIHVWGQVGRSVRARGERAERINVNVSCLE